MLWQFAQMVLVHRRSLLTEGGQSTCATSFRQLAATKETRKLQFKNTPRALETNTQLTPLRNTSASMMAISDAAPDNLLYRVKIATVLVVVKNAAHL